MRSRCGFTLMQLLVVISGVGITLGIGVLVLGAWEQGQRGWIVEWAFRPDAKVMAVGDLNGWVRLADAYTGETTRWSRVDQGRITAMTFSPDGTRLVTGSADGNVTILEAQTMQVVRTLRAHQRAVLAMAFSPNGHAIATSGREGTTKVWGTNSGELQATLAATASAIGFAGSDTLVTSERSVTTVWDLADQSKRFVLPVPAGTEVLGAAVSPDGSVAARSDGNGLEIWNLADGTQRFSIKSRAVYDVLFSRDGTVLVGRDVSRRARVNRGMPPWKVRLWSTSTGRELLTLPSGGFAPSAFREDGRQLIGVSWGKADLRWWDLRTGATRTVELRGGPSPWGRLVLAGACWVWAMAWVRVCPDGETLAAKVRARAKGENYVERLGWAAHPRIVLIALAMGVSVTAWIVFASGAFQSPAVSELGLEVPALFAGRPVAAACVGLLTGLAFFVPLVMWMKKTRPFQAEFAIVKQRVRLRFVGNVLSFVPLLYAMYAGVVLIAWLINASIPVAGAASVAAMGLLYWEQAALYRAAQARLAEVKGWRSEI